MKNVSELLIEKVKDHIAKYGNPYEEFRGEKFNHSRQLKYKENILGSDQLCPDRKQANNSADVLKNRGSLN